MGHKLNASPKRQSLGDYREISEMDFYSLLRENDAPAGSLGLSFPGNDNRTYCWFDRDGAGRLRFWLHKEGLI